VNSTVHRDLQGEGNMRCGRRGSRARIKTIFKPSTPSQERGDTDLNRGKTTWKRKRFGQVQNDSGEKTKRDGGDESGMSEGPRGGGSGKLSSTKTKTTRRGENKISRELQTRPPSERVAAQGGSNREK